MNTNGTLPLSRRRALTLGAGALASLAIRPTFAQEANAWTFAVLGTDKRTPEDSEQTDVIMVSRVDLAAGTVRTLSIPRDLYVEIPGVGSGKINAAFNYAVKTDPEQRWDIGAASTVETITHNFGIAIDGVALTDMGVFPQLIDAVGGVTVNNPYAVKDGTFADFPEGPITLTGEQAIRFCRTRHQDGDGGRVMRQQLVLAALLSKLQDPAMLTKVPELVATLSGNVVRTNIDAATQAKLIDAIPSITAENVVFGNIEDQLWSGYTSGGAWIYQGDWSALPGYVQSWLGI